MTIVSLLMWLPFVIAASSRLKSVRLRKTFGALFLANSFVNVVAQSECQSLEKLSWNYSNVAKEKMLLLFLFTPVNVPYVIFLLYVRHDLKPAQKYTLISLFLEK